MVVLNSIIQYAASVYVLYIKSLYILYNCLSLSLQVVLQSLVRMYIKPFSKTLPFSDKYKIYTLVLFLFKRC